MSHATTQPLAGLARACATRSADLAGEIPKARRADPRAIHHARTASRRLREILPVVAVLAEGHGAERLRRDVRRVTRALGPVREMDVAIALLHAMAAERGWDEQLVAWIGRSLEDERDRRRGKAQRALEAFDVDRLERRSAKLVARIDMTPTSAARRLAERTLADRTRRRAAKLIVALDRAGTLYAPDALHRVRIAAKKLRYTLELVRDATSTPTRPLVSTLKQAQDGLGRFHDLHVLEQRVRALGAERQPRGFARAADDIAIAIEHACRALHAEFLAARTSMAGVAARAHRDIPAALRRHGSLRMKLGTSYDAVSDPSRHRRRAKRQVA